MISRLFGMRLPLAIFILTILSFTITGTTIIHLTLINNMTDENWLRLKTEFIKLNFPKTWYVEKGSVDRNGKIFMISLFSEDFRAIVHFAFYSEAATQNFIKSNNITHVSLIPRFDVQEIYNWTRSQRSANATLHIVEIRPDLLEFIENWAKNHGYEIHYLMINIENAFVMDNTLYNTTGLFISSLINQRLIKIIFYGEENSWNKNQENFKKILNSLEISTSVWPV